MAVTFPGFGLKCVHCSEPRDTTCVSQSTAAELRGWLAIRNPRMTTATMLAVLGVLLSVSGMLDLLASK